MSLATQTPPRRESGAAPPAPPDPPDPPERRREPLGPEPLTNHEWQAFLRRVLTRRCPRCGRGELFASTFRLRRQCAVCSHVYRRDGGAMTGQMYLTTAVSEAFAVFLIALVFLGTSWGAATAIGICAPLVLAFSYWVLPRSMALWAAVDLMVDVVNKEPWTTRWRPPDGGANPDRPSGQNGAW